MSVMSEEGPDSGPAKKHTHLTESTSEAVTSPCPDVFERMCFTPEEEMRLKELDMPGGGSAFRFLEKSCEYTDAIAQYLAEIDRGNLDDDDSLPDYSNLVSELLDEARALPGLMVELGVDDAEAKTIVEGLVLKDEEERVKVFNLAFGVDCFEKMQEGQVGETIEVAYAQPEIDERGELIAMLVATINGELMAHMQSHMEGVRTETDRELLQTVAEKVFSEEMKGTLQRIGGHVIDTLKLTVGVAAGIATGLALDRYLRRKK